jgi:hypothetical protein
LGSPQGQPRPIKERKAERELFFWTARQIFWAARQTLVLVLFIALTVYAVISLAEGQIPGSELLLRYL